MIIAVFPGQGSQTPGFLRSWLEHEGVRARLEQFSQWAEVDLVEAGTEADAESIRDTRIAQPLIVAASLVSWELLAARTPLAFGGVAGHSVGEFAALTAAGVIDAETAMRLVGIRGRAMADAASLADTGMSAVIGGDQAVVEATRPPSKPASPTSTSPPPTSTVADRSSPPAPPKPWRHSAPSLPRERA